MTKQSDSTTDVDLTMDAILADVASWLANMEDKEFLRRLAEVADHPLAHKFISFDDPSD